MHTVRNNFPRVSLNIHRIDKWFKYNL